MRATFQFVGGGAGRSQANGPVPRWLAWPPPQAVTPAASASAATTRPALTRVRLIVQMPPSPSSGPPLLSESWSPPLFCGMPLDVDGGFFGAGEDFRAGGAAGCTAFFGADGAAGCTAFFGAGEAAGAAACDDDEPPPDFDA